MWPGHITMEATKIKIRKITNFFSQFRLFLTMLSLQLITMTFSELSEKYSEDINSQFHICTFLTRSSVKKRTNCEMYTHKYININ